MKTYMLFAICLIQISCARSPSNELEEMTEVVIKKHEGVDIRVMPVDVDKTK